MAHGVEMTEEEIYALPVVIIYLVAARAHGIGNKLARQMKAASRLPFPVRQQGRSWVTTKTQLLESLHMPPLPVPIRNAARLTA